MHDIDEISLMFAHPLCAPLISFGRLAATEQHAKEPSSFCLRGGGGGGQVSIGQGTTERGQRQQAWRVEQQPRVARPAQGHKHAGMSGRLGG